jgi:competence protein ComEC
VDTLHWLPREFLVDTLLSISFLDVGNGDATLLQASGGETWLLDGGPDSQGPLVAPVAARLLAMDLRELDTVTFTHPHADHIGGLPDVMRTFRVATVRDPGMAFPSFVYEELLLAVMESGAGYRILESGTGYSLSDHVTLEVIYTGADQQVNLDLNESSAVFLVRCGDFTALIAGDIEDETEMLLSGSLPPLTLILAPHHGSRTSAFPPFLRALRPQLAVFSAGRNNPFGHPHAAVLETYTDLGAEILRTDQLGTIVVHTDGMSVLYSTSMRGTSP